MHFDLWNGFIYPNINFFLFLFAAVYFFRLPLNNRVLEKKREYEQLVIEAKKAKDEAELKIRTAENRLLGLNEEIEEMEKRAFRRIEQDSKQISDETKKITEDLQKEFEQMSHAQLQFLEKKLHREILTKVRQQVVLTLDKTLNDQRQQEFVRKKLQGNFVLGQV